MKQETFIPNNCPALQAETRNKQGVNCPIYEIRFIRAGHHSNSLGIRMVKFVAANEMQETRHHETVMPTDALYLLLRAKNVFRIPPDLVFLTHVTTAPSLLQ